MRSALLPVPISTILRIAISTITPEQQQNIILHLKRAKCFYHLCPTRHLKFGKNVAYYRLLLNRSAPQPLQKPIQQQEGDWSELARVLLLAILNRNNSMARISGVPETKETVP
jgi:hypothetical protein